jgi:hypothetical protein
MGLVSRGILGRTRYSSFRANDAENADRPETIQMETTQWQKSIWLGLRAKAVVT